MEERFPWSKMLAFSLINSYQVASFFFRETSSFWDPVERLALSETNVRSPQNGGFQVRNLQTSRGLLSGANC